MVTVAVVVMMVIVTEAVVVMMVTVVMVAVVVAVMVVMTMECVLSLTRNLDGQIARTLTAPHGIAYLACWRYIQGKRPMEPGHARYVFIFLSRSIRLDFDVHGHHEGRCLDIPVHREHMSQSTLAVCTDA